MDHSQFENLIKNDTENDTSIQAIKFEVPLGLKYHIIDVYLNEWTKIELLDETIEKLNQEKEEEEKNGNGIEDQKMDEKQKLIDSTEIKLSSFQSFIILLSPLCTSFVYSTQPEILSRCKRELNKLIENFSTTFKQIPLSSLQIHFFTLASSTTCDTLNSSTRKILFGMANSCSRQSGGVEMNSTLLSKKDEMNCFHEVTSWLSAFQLRLLKGREIWEENQGILSQQTNSLDYWMDINIVQGNLFDIEENEEEKGGEEEVKEDDVVVLDLPPPPKRPTKKNKKKRKRDNHSEEDDNQLDGNTDGLPNLNKNQEMEESITQTPPTKAQRKNKKQRLDDDGEEKKPSISFGDTTSISFF